MADSQSYASLARDKDDRRGGGICALAWVGWFNSRRLLQPIGYLPPAEYGAQYYQQVAVA